MSSNYDDSDSVPSTPSSYAPSWANSVFDTEGPTVVDRFIDSNEESTRDSDTVLTSEHFDDIRPRVLRLATTVVWPGSDEETIEIQRVAHTEWWIVMTLKHDGQALILRTLKPGEDADIKQVLARAKFANNHIGLPVPEVIAVDETDNNPLGQPYVIQKKIIGANLQDFYDELSHDEKCQVATELGMYARKMLEASCSIAGNLNVPERVADAEMHVEEASASDETPDVEPPEIRLNRPFSVLAGANPEDTVVNVMIKMFEEHQDSLEDESDGEEEISSGDGEGDTSSNDDSSVNDDSDDEDSKQKDDETSVAESDFVVDDEENASTSSTGTGSTDFFNYYFDTFAVITRQLEERGCLESDRFSLSCTRSCADSIFDSNQIMVSTKRAPGEPLLNGFFETEHLRFGPKFLSCQPPMWLWTPDEPEYIDRYCRYDQRQANRALETAEQRQIKASFDEAAGPEFVRLAYPAEYRIARRLYDFCLTGYYRYRFIQKESMYYYQALEMIEEVAELKEKMEGSL